MAEWINTAFYWIKLPVRQAAFCLCWWEVLFFVARTIFLWLAGISPSSFQSLLRFLLYPLSSVPLSYVRQVDSKPFWCFWKVLTWHAFLSIFSTFFSILHCYILLTPAEPMLGLTKISPKERFCSVGSECCLELKTTQRSIVRNECASLCTCCGDRWFKDPILLYTSENWK